MRLRYYWVDCPSLAVCSSCSGREFESSSRERTWDEAERRGPGHRAYDSETGLPLQAREHPYEAIARRSREEAELREKERAVKRARSRWWRRHPRQASAFRAVRREFPYFTDAQCHQALFLGMVFNTAMDAGRQLAHDATPPPFVPIEGDCLSAGWAVLQEMMRLEGGWSTVALAMHHRMLHPKGDTR